MYNSKSFLENGKYVDSELAKDKFQEDEEGKDIPTEFTIKHTFKQHGEKVIEFDICESMASLRPEQWSRLAAVFVYNPDYQFKDWKVFKEESDNKVVNILQRVRGFFMTYSDLKVSDNVKKINVNVLNVDRNQRHKDQEIYNMFWEEMWLHLNKEKYRIKK